MHLTNAEFRALVEEHQSRAQSVAYGLLRNPEDAREVVQEAFLRVYLHAEDFEERAKFSTWLYRIVVNLSIDALRKHPPGIRVEVCAEIPEETLSSDPHEALHGKELVVAMRRALEDLPRYHREAIVLREIEEQSYEQMAEETGVSIGTVMSRLFYARKKMQENLRKVA